MGNRDGVHDHLGPRLAAKPMHMFWLLDVSGSMAVDGKIESLNDAMAEAVEAVREAVKENPGVQVLARVITFAHGADWHIEDPVDIEELEWSAVEVVERGTTELGLALRLATEAIREVAQAGRGLPPALILVSDGKPTDLKAPSFGAALRELAEEPWGKKASRVAIGIGSDADMAALHRFIGHDEIEPIRAGNAAELTHYLRWASTVVVDEKTRPAFGWDSVLIEPERTDQSEGAKEQGLPEGQPQELHPPPEGDKDRSSPSDQSSDQSDALTKPDDAPTVPAPQAQVEEPPTPPAPTIDTSETPTVPAVAPPEQPRGPARNDLPHPPGQLATETDGDAEDLTTPTVDISEEPTRPAVKESPASKTPPKGPRREDLPPPPGLQPPPPPGSDESEGPEW